MILYYNIYFTIWVQHVCPRQIQMTFDSNGIHTSTPQHILYILKFSDRHDVRTCSIYYIIYTVAKPIHAITAFSTTNVSNQACAAVGTDLSDCHARPIVLRNNVSFRFCHVFQRFQEVSRREKEGGFGGWGVEQPPPTRPAVATPSARRRHKL